MRVQAERLRNPLNLERYRVRLQAPRGIGDGAPENERGSRQGCFDG